MAYFITESCVSCGQCESECPQSCITAGDDAYVIDAATCVECGVCADVCPVDAPKQQ
jgi:NAD-dependent dihydropyrimidine dehydrogenase PreA subunit